MRALITALVLVALLAAPLATARAAPDERIEEIMEEIQELRDLVKMIDARLDKLMDKVLSLRDEDDSEASEPKPEPSPAGVLGTYSLDHAAMIEAWLEVRVDEEAEDLDSLQPNERKERIAEIRKEIESDVRGFHLSLTLLEGGTFTAKANFMGEDQTARGVWELDGTEITLSATHANDEEQKEPDEISGSLRGGSLRLDDGDMIFIMRKEK